MDIVLASDIEVNARARILADQFTPEELLRLLAVRNRRIQQAREFGAKRDILLWAYQNRIVVHKAQVEQNRA